MGSFMDWVNNPGAKMREMVGTETEEDRKKLGLTGQRKANALVDARLAEATSDAGQYRDGKDAGELGKKWDDTFQK